MANSRQVLLTGGGPWGVKLTGGKDFCSPLLVSKVTAGSKAASGGIKDGDYILMINNSPTEDLKHHDAQALIRNTGQTLRLTISSQPPKRATAPVENVPTTVVPNTRPAPPTAPTTVVPNTRPAPPTPPTANTRPAPPTAPTVSSQVNKPVSSPQKVVHTSGGVTINVQKSRPPPPKSANQQSPSVTTPPSRPAPPPSRPTPPVGTVTSPTTVVTPPATRLTPTQSPWQLDGGVITDSILTDETDLNQSAESTLQSPAFRRITISDDEPHPSALSPHPSTPSTVSTVIKPPVMGTTHPTPPPATVTKGILKSPTKPVAPPPVKPTPPKPATVAGINRPAPPPVTVVKPPPTSGSDTASKKAYERQADCAKCNDPIRGPFATAMNSNWHPQCFCCSSCSQPLSNTTFVIEGNDVYCEQCYKHSVAPICEDCQQAITGNYMTAVGRYWHAEHFICYQCHTKLSGGEGGFHYDEGRLFCPQCFTASCGVQCFGCKQLIGGNELWVEAMDQNWHPGCFVCAVCRNPLEGQSFFVKAGNPYCSNCK